MICVLHRAGGGHQSPPQWDATETLVWFGASFPFADVYIDRFAALDLDMAALRGITDEELLTELSVRAAVVAVFLLVVLLL